MKYKHLVRQTNCQKEEYHIVMELLQGRNMAQHLTKKGRPEDMTIVQTIGKQLISALKDLHSHNIVHQNLKDRNVIFGED